MNSEQPRSWRAFRLTSFVVGAINVILFGFWLCQPWAENKGVWIKEGPQWLADSFWLNAPGMIAVSILEIRWDTKAGAVLVTAFTQLMATLFWAGVVAWLEWEIRQFPRWRRCRGSSNTAPPVSQNDAPNGEPTTSQSAMGDGPPPP